MADQLSLQFETRSDVGSRAARKVRRQGRIPGVLYGHGDPLPISIDLAEFRRLVKPNQYGSAMLHLQDGKRKAGIAMVKSVHADMLGHGILSIDLQRVTSTESLPVSLPVVLQGHPVGLRAGGTLDQAAHSVTIRCKVSEVPAQLEYDISGLDLNDILHANQLELPAGAELLDPADMVIAVMLAPRVSVQDDGTAAAPEASGPELTGEKQSEDFPSER